MIRMKMMKKNMMIEILNNEVRPAMGCTEPVSVVLAAAKARGILDEAFVDSVDVKVSPNFYKNGLSVGIPQTDLVGLDMASAIGAAGGDADLGLEILSTVDEDVVERAKEYLSQGLIRVSIADTAEKVLVDVTVKAGKKTRHKLSYLVTMISLFYLRKKMKLYY